jgi:hypothetical protein
MACPLLLTAVSRERLRYELSAANSPGSQGFEDLCSNWTFWWYTSVYTITGKRESRKTYKKVNEIVLVKDNGSFKFEGTVELGFVYISKDLLMD